MVNIWPLFSQLIGDGCPLCGAPGDRICTTCDSALPYNLNPCPHCALPLPAAAPAGTRCAECQRRAPPYARVLAPLLYRPPVDDLVAGFKYHHRLDLGRMLADLLAAAIAGLDAPPQLLLPVPADGRRLRERGFNQAAELARGLSARTGIEWNAAALRRRDGRAPQRGLGRRIRHRNLRGVFHCVAPLPRHVALVDDVVTTGATIEEATRALRQVGVETVEVWAVARTPLGSFEF